MRITTTIDRLTENQWTSAQKVLRTSYDIPMDASRACLVVEHRGEERHAELPLFAYMGLVGSLGLKAVDDGLGTVTPDALPDHLEQVRNAADPARRPVLPTADQLAAELNQIGEVDK